MSSNARIHLEQLSFNQHTADCDIELIFIGPADNSLDTALFKDAVESLRSKTSLSIHLLFGGSSVYEAMNIGISHAQGEYLFFCGDTDKPLRNHLLSCLDLHAASFGNTQVRPVIVGLIQKSGRLIKARLPKARGISLAIERNPTPHQAIIYPAEIFKLLGVYSLAFQVLGDYEFHLRLRRYINTPRAMIGFVETNIVFCDFQAGGISELARFSNYVESFKCKKHYVRGYLLPVALIVEAVAYLYACIQRLSRDHR